MKTSIIICKGSGHVSIPAEPVTIQGFACAVHKSIGKSGWSVSSVEKGIAIVVGWKDKGGAVREAERRILNKGTDAVRASLDTYPALPASAPAFEAPKKIEGADVDTIVRLVGERAGLTDRERAAVRKALNGRTGQLKAKSPSAFGDADERLACAAWQGIQPNPFKVGTVACLAFSRDLECTELFRKLTAIQWPDAFDSDKKKLVDLGVW